MQENILPGALNYTKVEQKLELLAQAKLKNLTHTNFKALQDRTAHLEKALTEQMVVAERNDRQCRSRLRKMQEEVQQIEQKCGGAMALRRREIIDLKNNIAQFQLGQHEGRDSVQEWLSNNLQAKIETLNCSVRTLREGRTEEIRCLEDQLTQEMPESRRVLEEKGQRYDQLLTRKLDKVKQDCDDLKGDMANQEEKRERGDRKMMEFLRGVIGEIKMVIGQERTVREQNRDKLMRMMQQTFKNLAVK